MCLKAAIVPYSGVQALKHLLHYHGGNASVVPFVSLGTDDHLLSLHHLEVIRTSSSNYSCGPFCYSKIPFSPTSFALQHRGTVKVYRFLSHC